MTRPANIALDMLDEVRRGTGLLLDALGFGPRTTPSTVLDVTPGVRLHDYPSAPPSGPPVLLVPAPIKRSYIWDIEPDLSVVARCLEHGMRVHLVEWTDPGRAQQRFGLDQYAGRLLVECLRVVTERTGVQRVPLVGHSLGGTFCAVCAARHPDLVTAIALLEAPLHFGADAGAFTAFVSATPAASSPPLSVGGVPGSFLDIVTATAAPGEFQFDRWTDFVRSAADPVVLASYLRVLRWTMDEFRLSERLFSDVVERLYRADEFMRGSLVLSGQPVGPATLVVPMLDVVDPRSEVVPPCSIMRFHEAAASAEKRVLEYHGDTGVAVQHVGVLVGHNAHRDLWPEILGWLTRLPTSR